VSRALLALVVAAAPGLARADVTVLLGGDVLLGRGVVPEGQPVDRGLLRALADQRRGADIVIVGLESPFGACLPGGTVPRPRLCARPGAEAVLVAGTVDAANLANNHALDAGPDGLAGTAALLARAGVTPLGLRAARAGRPEVEPLGGLQVVAASVTPAAHAPASRLRLPGPEDVARTVRGARASAPRRPVLVLLHGGREGDPEPAARDLAYARAAVDAGAAAVVFNGAHVVRPLVTVHGVPVHLGLGNLLFDQRDPRSRVGVLLRLRFRPGAPAEVVDVTEVPASTAPQEE
jgi:poly-gamma-glutamate synthesis protein (capsule biosynthesis protein)